MSEEQAEKEIDNAKFEKVKGGNYWYFDTKDPELGEITINRETTGAYVISQEVNGSVVDSYITDGSIREVKEEAKEFAKGRWRSIFA